MPLIHPRISVHSGPEVVKKLVELHARRHRGGIGRQAFLARWHELRLDLEGTPEYQEFREKVIARAGGVCERCNKRRGRDVHHRKQMSYYPALALDVENGEYVCRPCHKASPRHGHLRT